MQQNQNNNIVQEHPGGMHQLFMSLDCISDCMNVANVLTAHNLHFNQIKFIGPIRFGAKNWQISRIKLNSNLKNSMSCMCIYSK